MALIHLGRKHCSRSRFFDIATIDRLKGSISLELMAARLRSPSNHGDWRVCFQSEGQGLLDGQHGGFNWSPWRRGSQGGCRTAEIP
ncbi:hypothetical protein HZ326_24834 [Fusarium oxysporum f. sp. albedinis]|nr:hypothetical protein HZ326_24834 [Fusarium oxysporum f. sp. albedinis]